MSDDDSKSEISHSQIAILGDNANVEGGIHYHLHYESPPPEAVRISPAPRPYADTKNLICPGGAMDTDSPFYIKRPADDAVSGGIRRPRGLVTIRGARQTGKTSLIMQMYVNARASDIPLRSVFVDFQALQVSDFESLDSLWKAIETEIACQLDTEILSTDSRQQNSRYDQRLSGFLDRSVFAEDDTPLLLCLDEADRVFSFPVKSEFFASVRAFYNRGAYDPAWKRVNWLLSTSSEPALFIEDLNQSPFNIGMRVELPPFTSEETAEFADCHGLFPDASLLERIMAYAGGHPYLLHLLFYHMALNPESLGALLDAPSAGNGIFGEHLNRFLKIFQKEPELAGAMKRVIEGKGCKNVKQAERLEAAGLARRDEHQKLMCSCGLYADYFSRELS